MIPLRRLNLIQNTLRFHSLGGSLSSWLFNTLSPPCSMLDSHQIRCIYRQDDFCLIHFKTIPTPLYFPATHNLSEIYQTGPEVQVTSVDQYVFDHDQIPSLIKADVEDMEIALIEGAQTTIRKHRPQLALAVYHQPDNANKITTLLNNWKTNYRFVFRGLNERGNGPVLLFAFPL